MSDDKQSKRSSGTSTIEYLFLLVFICWIMRLSGCEGCEDTASGTECAGKSIGEVYKEMKTGFDKVK